MIKINRSFSNFHHFWGVYDHKVPTKSNQWVESVRETGINSFLWKTCILGAIYHRIWQQLQMVFSHPPSGTMKLTSGSNQWYKRGQKSPLDPTALAKLLHSGYSLVHNRLKTSKMANIMIPPPPPTWVKTNIWENQPRGGVWGIPLNIFTSWNPDKHTFLFVA